ncbi:hypothetical protein HAX54_048564 [Datura stramonium]|uniref:Membrane-associated kinase regulator 5 n=1 Tax=Datura stramonium TaxID=4076 RepID=A0ABS8STV7_DATST|nr:hypothetical protein [Datura stramonium]
MEAFNLLKFWRTTAVKDIDSDFDSVKKWADAVTNPVAPETTDEEIDNDEDSFFDLVFTGHNNGHPKENNISKLNSPTDIFVKPKPLPIDPNSKPLSPNSVLNSAPKFRVCFLGFRKSKPEKADIDDSSLETQTQKLSPKSQSKVPEEVPISCISFRYRSSKLRKEEEEEEDSSNQFARADMGKYLKLMKPLYHRASKRYTQKINASDKVSIGNQFFPSTRSLSSPRNSSEEKQGNRVAVLGAVRKRLGKNWSTPSSFAGTSTSPMNRRDDSLLEQSDGIQGAILHCKRSYSSARKGAAKCYLLKGDLGIVCR